MPETNFVEPVRTTRPSSANISQALQRIEPGLGECVDSTGVPPDSSIAISIFSLGTTGATEQVDVQVNGQEHPALKKCIIDVIVDADPLLPPFDSVGKFINFEVVPSTGGIDVRARGVLPRQTIRDVIRSHLDEVRSCYNEGLRRNPELAGKLTIQFIIDANGKVRSVEVVDADPFPDSEVAACVANAALKWLFPEPRGGGDVTVTYPFSFKTEVRTPSSNSE